MLQDNLIGYKIVEKKHGNVLTLFHANFGSRIMPVGEWIECQVREQAKDGTSKTTYRSGFHILPSYDEALEYLQRFKSPRHLAIFEVQYPDNFWEKTHSPSNTRLADRMMLIREVSDHKIGD